MLLKIGLFKNYTIWIAFLDNYGEMYRGGGLNKKDIT